MNLTFLTETGYGWSTIINSQTFMQINANVSYI